MRATRIRPHDNVDNEEQRSEQDRNSQKYRMFHGQTPQRNRMSAVALAAILQSASVRQQRVNPWQNQPRNRIHMICIRASDQTADFRVTTAIPIAESASAEK